MSVRAPSWHDEVRACALTRFVPYLLHKFIITSSFSYLWIWHISVLTSCQVLSAEYVRVQLVNFSSFFLHLHAVEIFFCTIFLCLRVVSCPVSLFLHAGFDSFSSCLHTGINFFLIWTKLNHIYNTLPSWGWSHLKGVHIFPPHYHVKNFANRAPCRDLVKRSASICSMLQYEMDLFCFQTCHWQRSNVYQCAWISQLPTYSRFFSSLLHSDYTGTKFSA